MKTTRKTALKKRIRSKVVSQIKVYPEISRAYHIRIDKKLKAKRVGVRKSASGNKYTERRENRSDKNRRKRL